MNVDMGNTHVMGITSIIPNVYIDSLFAWRPGCFNHASSDVLLTLHVKDRSLGDDQSVRVIFAYLGFEILQARLVDAQGMLSVVLSAAALATTLIPRLLPFAGLDVPLRSSSLVGVDSKCLFARQCLLF